MALQSRLFPATSLYLLLQGTLRRFEIAQFAEPFEEHLQNSLPVMKLRTSFPQGDH